MIGVDVLASPLASVPCNTVCRRCDIRLSQMKECRKIVVCFKVSSPGRIDCCAIPRVHVMECSVDLCYRDLPIRVNE